MKELGIKSIDNLKTLSEIIIISVGICYATGLLILTARFYQLGLQDADLELYKTKNIVTGFLFWLFPILLGVPFISVWNLRTKIISALIKGKLRRQIYFLGHLFLFEFYVVFAFAPLSLIDRQGKILLGNLALILAMLIVCVFLQEVVRHKE